jgi:8-oxo-dGTP pyrophosphatase MutT (NUDIX family)
MPPSLESVSPVRAATLVLLRQHSGELQVYLLRRSPASGFMPGLFVFPGGRVDAADCDEAFWEEHQDLTPDAVDERLGKGLCHADALSNAVAVIRETFEEAGILLALMSGAADDCLKKAEERRIAENRRSGWFRALVQSERWRLMTSALIPWAHWITPAGMPQRYDTRFFTALLPDGQSGRPDLYETTEGLWLSPEQALADNLAGRVPLSPSTLVTLYALLKHPTLKSLQADLKERGWGPPLSAQLVDLGKNAGSLIIEPWDPMYGRDDLEIDPRKLPLSVLSAEAPFSRLWDDGGIWKPVGLT